MQYTWREKLLHDEGIGSDVVYEQRHRAGLGRNVPVPKFSILKKWSFWKIRKLHHFKSHLPNGVFCWGGIRNDRHFAHSRWRWRIPHYETILEKGKDRTFEISEEEETNKNVEILDFKLKTYSTMRRIIVVPLEKPPVERNPESERGIALCGVTQTFTDFVFGQKDLTNSNKIRKSRNS